MQELIHPTAYIGPNCEIADNVGTGTKIWGFSHILVSAVIGQDCNICEGIFVKHPGRFNCTNWILKNSSEPRGLEGRPAKSLHPGKKTFDRAQKNLKRSYSQKNKNLWIQDE